jgi:hypothetical protein
MIRCDSKLIVIVFDNAFYTLFSIMKVLENFEARGSNSESMVHVINMNVIDNPEVSLRVPVTKNCVLRLLFRVNLRFFNLILFRTRVSRQKTEDQCPDCQYC